MKKMVPLFQIKMIAQQLSDVCEGRQLVLTRNGKAAYTVVDIEEWRKTQAKLRLFEELQKSYQSLRTEEPVSREEFIKNLSIG
ncbi:Antitoxin Phd_YefM, type II toxin-antitoxin system [Streptococcus henryi]|uniref:Antitoxin Phd_YefM, type II toxin-antitoxin system n=1 Tax=Streptococcus henryi TaxID=439219 RepID=A0A1G6C442_9STRE|nr:prevent-host-death protein [Streptococcus henryi]SDB27620.1 Antitoxin Phd_YefM, type II toxin-antitoxin system [Streptococcus henryi]